MEEKHSRAADGAAQPSGAEPTAAAPQPRRFPSVGDLLALLGLAFAAQVLVGGLVALVFMVGGWSLDYARMDPHELGRLMACIYLASMSATLLGALWYRRMRGGRGPWARFSLWGFHPALLLWAFVAILAIGAVLEPVLRLLPRPSLEVGRGFWTILSLVVFAPVFEELLCRGVVLGSVRSRWGATAALFVSALFFGVLHVQPAQAVAASAIGLILGFVYLATDSLWASMILHALNNAVAYLALAAGRGDALLIDLIPSRGLYAAVYGCAVLLLLGSGWGMARALRRMREAQKNASAA